MQLLQRENDELRHAKLTTAPNLLRLEQLEAENARLRKLLVVNERENAKGQVAQILYTARDPFSRKVIVDKGQQSGIVAGQPAIDEAGVVGQVTRVFPFSSEITLITDKDQAVPVQIVRTGQRSVVFGLGNGQLELRFMPVNADVQEGDLLVTSGLDGVFLADDRVGHGGADELDEVLHGDRLLLGARAAKAVLGAPWSFTCDTPRITVAYGVPQGQWTPAAMGIVRLGARVERDESHESNNERDAPVGEIGRAHV